MEKTLLSTPRSSVDRRSSWCLNLTAMASNPAVSLPPRKSRRSKLQAEHVATLENSEDASVPRFCVIGGGIAGVCCAQELSRLNPTQQIVLVSATDCLREATAIMKLTSNLEELSVFERRADQFSMDNKNIRVISASLTSLDHSTKTLHLSNGKTVAFSQVCFCTGSQPKTLLPRKDSHHQRCAERARHDPMSPHRPSGGGGGQWRHLHGASYCTDFL